MSVECGWLNNLEDAIASHECDVCHDLSHQSKGHPSLEGIVRAGVGGCTSGWTRVSPPGEDHSNFAEHSPTS
jgi:hypothetical protein